MRPEALLPVDASITTDAASLLPIQHTRRRAAIPERRLMAAVLSQAVADFRRHASDERPIGRHLHWLASEWIASRDVSWPYSFENICLTFDLDPHEVRRSLIRDRARRAVRRPSSRTSQTIELTPRSGTADGVWVAIGVRAASP
jgi:hypothetical protein